MAAEHSCPAGFDLVTIGRIGVDLYPEQMNTRLADVRTFHRSLGGSPTNVAVAAARLGRRTAVITKVGDDEFGAYVREALDQLGVWTGWVRTDPDLRTPVVFAEIHSSGETRLLFYRLPKAPDANLTVADFNSSQVDSARILWVSGQSLAEDPTRTTILQMMGRKQENRTTVIDLDHRPSLWSSRAEAEYWMREAVTLADLVVGNLDEVTLLTGSRAPEHAAAQLLEMGPTVAVVKLGDKGVCAADTTGTQVTLPSIAVETYCELGAGDAFGGAMCHGLLAKWPLDQTLRYANAAGALVASRLACADAMPGPDEIERLVTHE